MVIVRLKEDNDLLEKLSAVLDDAMLRKDNHIVLLTESTFHETIHIALSRHKKVGKMVMGGKVVYCIKEMRIELEQITYSI